MTELERYKAKLIRLLKHKDEEPNNTYHDWDEEILRCKINIADEVMEEKTGWIPVSERLPETDAISPGWSIQVLIITTGGKQDVVSFYYHGYGGALNQAETYEYHADEIIAWMPLPEPYRPE